MDVLRLGILFSTAGAYGALSRDCLDGADLAVADLHAEGSLPFSIVPVFGDPAGCAESYSALASG